MTLEDRVIQPSTFRLSISVVGLFTLAGCSSPTSYAGIPAKPGTAPVELQTLADRAKSGDKQAQLELAQRLEHGRGIPANQRLAVILYRKAAADSGGARTFFVPQNGGSVRAVPISSGPFSPGLQAAKQRLQELKSDYDSPYSDRARSPVGMEWKKQFYVQFIPLDDLQDCDLSQIKHTVNLLNDALPNNNWVKGACLFRLREITSLNKLARQGNMRAIYLTEVSKIDQKNVCEHNRVDQMAKLATKKFLTPLVSAGSIALYCGRRATATNLYGKAVESGAGYAIRFVDASINQ